MKKILILCSYFSLSFANSIYADTVKDTKGNDLLYCKDYTMKIGKEYINLLFNNANNSYYLTKSTNNQKEQMIFQIKPTNASINKCNDPVNINDEIFIEFVYMNNNNRYLTYLDPNNGINNPYYYAGEVNISKFHLQESVNNKEKSSFYLVNSDKTILNCMNKASCTSIEMTDIESSKLVFETYVTEINQQGNLENNDNNKQDENPSTEDLLNKLSIKIEDEINRWNSQIQNFRNLSTEDLKQLEIKIKDRIQKIKSEADGFGGKASPLLVNLKNESEKVLLKIKEEHDRKERQLKEEAERFAQRVREEAERIERQAREEAERIERQVKEEAARITSIFSGW